MSTSPTGSTAAPLPISGGRVGSLPDGETPRSGNVQQAPSRGTAAPCPASNPEPATASSIPAGPGVAATATLHRLLPAGPVAALEREVAVEVPVSLSYSSVPFAVMMATPADLEDFALGFSLCEGVVEALGDVRAIVATPDAEGGQRVEITLTGAALRRHLARQRNRPGRVIAGRTGCGICGVEDASALPWARAPGTAAPPLYAGAIRRALSALEAAQPLNRRTNAAHAAAWVALDGTLALLREDVGRHNALDKLVGAVTRAGFDRLAGFVLVTSRCSYEMVEKAAALGARALVSISLPTSLALDRARSLDMTLIAGTRGDILNVFHGADRVLEGEPPSGSATQAGAAPMPTGSRQAAPAPMPADSTALRDRATADS